MRVLSSIALTLAVSLASAPVLAKGGGLAPNEAAEARAAFEASVSPDPSQASEELRLEAERQGDPELFLLAATRARMAAEMDRDTELAAKAESLALIAGDVASYLADTRNFETTDWQPVTRARAMALVNEAETEAEAARALIVEIDNERLSAAAEAERKRQAELEAAERKRKKAGLGLIGGGSAALVAGIAGVGVLGAGVSKGLSTQKDAEALVLPAELDQLAELDKRGSSANVMAYVGGALAGVGLGVGIALIAVGVKKRKAAGPGSQAAVDTVRVGGWALRDSAGLTLQGSF